MYFQYGSFQHDINLVNVESFNQRVVYTPRGAADRVVKTMTISGDLIPETASQAAIRSKIQALENAYNTDRLDAGLMHDDGTPSPHFLDHGTSISGVRVTALDYPKGDDPRSGQYATSRFFRIQLEAEYLVASEELLIWRETVTIRGNGGPRYAVIELDQGPPVIEQVSNYTPVQVIQSGIAVGRTGYPQPAPIFTGGGLVLQGPGVVVPLEGPQVVGNGAVNYTTRWSYEYLSAGTVTPGTFLPHVL